ncbi:matrixin family metalloprotease [Methylomonas sp. TEB]|uniref:matrixin family metalloprotease n=1 Tax=Methylomonas sp. TEB TaxID=3398229 RepID=UPI0039F4E872
MVNRLYRVFAGIGFLLVANAAMAFNTFDDGSGGVLKWGGSNTPGTPGGTISWGFIPAGTAGSAYCGDACPGTAQTTLNIENSPGTGYTPVLLTDLQGAIEAAMDKWASVANISFVGPFTDSGLAINNPAAGNPDIRIGVFAFASGGGAVGYAPPPNGGTGSGDIIFDANSFYGFQPGKDGDTFFPGGSSTAPNDFESLLLHELGHALGLAHPAAFDSSCPVMEVSGSCFGKINRTLDADDIAGIQYLYGAPAPVPLPAAVWSFGAALFGLSWLNRKRDIA